MTQSLERMVGVTVQGTSMDKCEAGQGKERSRYLFGKPGPVFLEKRDGFFLGKKKPLPYHMLRIFIRFVCGIFLKLNLKYLLLPEFLTNVNEGW
jgi:hypothetical protein